MLVLLKLMIKNLPIQHASPKNCFFFFFFSAVKTAFTEVIQKLIALSLLSHSLLCREVVRGSSAALMALFTLEDGVKISLMAMGVWNTPMEIVTMAIGSKTLLVQ